MFESLVEVGGLDEDEGVGTFFGRRLLVDGDESYLYEVPAVASEPEYFSYFCAFHCRYGEFAGDKGAYLLGDARFGLGEAESVDKVGLIYFFCGSVFLELIVAYFTFNQFAIDAII